jgi:ABC-type oligopeptide transport system ATPase subunit
VPVPNEHVLAVRDLKMHFPVRAGLLKRIVGHVFAVDGVTFHIEIGRAHV